MHYQFPATRGYIPLGEWFDEVERENNELRHNLDTTRSQLASTQQMLRGAYNALPSDCTAGSPDLVDRVAGNTRELEELRRFKAAALTLTTEASVELAMSKEKT